MLLNGHSERVSTPSERISKGFEHLVASVFTKISYIDTCLIPGTRDATIRRHNLKGQTSGADDEVVQFLSITSEIRIGQNDHGSIPLQTVWVGPVRHCRGGHPVA